MEAGSSAFKAYCEQVLKNTKALEKGLQGMPGPVWLHLPVVCGEQTLDSLQRFIQQHRERISGIVLGSVGQLGRKWDLPYGAGSGIPVILIGVLTRIFLGNGHWTNPNATAYYQKEGPRYWVFQFVNALGICGLTALVLEQMDPAFYNIVFNVSAALILLSIFDRQGKTYPTTHHETLVVAYAMAATGANVVLSIAFGMLANLIYLLFARYFNENCDTHIDPPAIAIEICSLILFTCF